MLFQPRGRLHAVAARNVRRLMVGQYRTQKALADAAHMNPVHLSKLLSGHVGFGLYDLERLATALGAQPHELIMED
jgi:transcriptional regulator with XRE-family HTH domain